MRKIILSMQVSLDGFVEGANKDMSWISYEEAGWQELFELLKQTDTILLGRKMYPDYTAHWNAMLADPAAPANEIKYAQIAEKIPHIVFSTTLKQEEIRPIGSGKTTLIKDNMQQEIKKLKQLPQGKDIMVWGGAQFASSLMNWHLIDEYRLVVNPVVLGGGTALFKNVKSRFDLKLLQCQTFKSGAVSFHYKAG